MEEEALGLIPAGSPRAAQCPPPGAGPTLPLSRFPQAGSADPRRLPSLPLASVFQGISLGCPSVPHKCTCACFSCGLWNPDPAFSPHGLPRPAGLLPSHPRCLESVFLLLEVQSGGTGAPAPGAGVRYADLAAPSQSYSIRICILTRPQEV